MKAKVTLKATMVYDLNPKSYPHECDTFAKMLQLDLKNFKDEPYLFLDYADDIETIGELIEE